MTIHIHVWLTPYKYNWRSNVDVSTAKLINIDLTMNLNYFCQPQTHML